MDILNLREAASKAHLHRRETVEERSMRILRELLPDMGSRDQAVDYIFTLNPEKFPMQCVAAALYILAGQPREGEKK